MITYSRGAAAIAALLGSLIILAPTPANSSKSAVRFMRVYGETLPPVGHVQFCRRHPSECTRHNEGHKRLKLSKKRWNQLVAVNNLVNGMVRPVTDLDQYGTVEHWAYPRGRGDCEDYVLLKRQLLIDEGWPKSALLITVVRDEQGEGHAVLTARTANGDFVLDNKQAAVRGWKATGYKFLKRQSYRDPRIWMSLTPRGGGSLLSASGTRYSK